MRNASGSQFNGRVPLGSLFFQRRDEKPSRWASGTRHATPIGLIRAEQNLLAEGTKKAESATPRYYLALSALDFGR
jgi:hypothetical protein